MEKLMNENAVKKALKVDSFEKMNKKKASEFVSIISKMDKDVAIKAIEESSKITLAMKDFLNESLKNLVKSSDDSIKYQNENFKEIIKALLKKLDEKDITSEESKYIIDKIIFFQEMQSKENEKHRNFLLQIAGIAGTVALAVFGINKLSKK